MKSTALLIVPPVRLSQPPSRFPLGLGYVAAILEKEQFEVKVLDLNVLRLDDASRRNALANSLKNVDVVATGGMITMLNHIREIVSIVKENSPLLPVVVGGPLTSHFQELILGNLAADALVMGEGEAIVPELFRALINKGTNLAEIPGVITQCDGKVQFGPHYERIADLDSLPFPAYHLFDFEQYVHNRGSTRATDIIGSRGCPHQCSFCHRNFGNRVHFRSVDSIVDEIKFLKTFYNIGHVHLEDELFVQREDYVSDFCEKISQLGQITWSACARANTINPELLSIMKTAGCSGLMVGLESFSDSVLANAAKGITVEQNEQACRWISEAGIKLMPSLIIGLPDETEQTLKETTEGVMRHHIALNEWQYAFATPYPGTELYRIARERGCIDNDWDYIQQLCEVGDTNRMTINLTDLPDEVLLNAQRQLVMESQMRFSQKNSAKKTTLPWGALGVKLKSLFNRNERAQGDKDQLLGRKGLPVVKEHFLPGLDLEKQKELFKRSVRMVEVEVFSYCNRECSFCPNSFIDRKSQNVRMEADLYSRIISSLQEINYRGVLSFSRYNEPLADEIIFERLREAKTRLPDSLLHLNTNGDYFKNTLVDDLYDAGLRSLNIQVYLPDDMLFDDVSVAELVAERINRYGLPSQFIKSEPKTWLEYALHFKDMKIRLYARNFNKTGSDRGGVLTGLNNQVPRGDRSCLIPFEDIYIDYNGAVMPCCNMRSDVEAHLKYKLGDLSDPKANVFSVYGSDNAVKFRKELLLSVSSIAPCRQCSFLIDDGRTDRLSDIRKEFENYIC